MSERVELIYRLHDELGEVYFGPRPEKEKGAEKGSPTKIGRKDFPRGEKRPAFSKDVRT